MICLTLKVLVADINIGYEDIVNTKVSIVSFPFFISLLIVIALSLDSGPLNPSSSSFSYVKVLAFNGKPVKNLKSLASMVESCNDEYLKFDLEYDQVPFLSSSCFECLCETWHLPPFY